MDLIRIKKNVRKSIAKIQYYGIGYIFDIILNKMHLSDEYKSMAKVEERYCHLAENEYLEEMSKWFTANTGEKLDLQNPVTFNQKIQWLKVYDNTSEKTLLADKYLVRGWVEKKIGGKYLIPLLGVWDCFDDIDFTALPDKFVLKCNHGSHMNIVVKDKSNLDKMDAKQKMDIWMQTKFSKKGFEQQYRNIIPKIIAEEYIENLGGEIYDYKFFCFSGKVKYIQFLSDRQGGLKAAYFDVNWNLQPFTNNHPFVNFSVNKLNNLEEMIEIAEKLADGFSFVRVDLYRLNDGTIKFGEMTFSPASGTQDWRPAAANRMLGNLVVLPKKS